MTDGVTWSDAALRRSGIEDPAQIHALRALLEDTDSPIALTNVSSYADTEPRWAVCDVEDEISRLLDVVEQQRPRTRSRRGP